MRTKRATLIQDVRELLAALRPHLDLILEKFSNTGVTYEDALEWILAEQVEHIFGLFDERHQFRRSNLAYQVIHQELDGVLPQPLGRYISYYLRAPALYDDNIVQLRLLGCDLYIAYWRHPYEPMAVVSFPPHS